MDIKDVLRYEIFKEVKIKNVVVPELFSNQVMNNYKVIGLVHREIYILKGI